jgi:uncharacterized membrane protein YjgN (DUF898 family)
MNLRNYKLNHVRYGSSQFRYRGDGLEYFVLFIKGYFLTLITIGIYSFWWQRDIYNYYVNNLSWEFSDGRRIQFRSTATGGGFFRLLAGNLLLVVFTFGIGFAWAQVRTIRFILGNAEFDGDADLNAVVQTEAEHKNALADDLGDLMDIGVFFLGERSGTGDLLRRPYQPPLGGPGERARAQYPGGGAGERRPFPLADGAQGHAVGAQRRSPASVVR